MSGKWHGTDDRLNCLDGRAAEGLYYEKQNLPRASGMKNDLFTSL